MTELVSGMPAPQSGTNLHEWENQSRFQVLPIPVFRFNVRYLLVVV
jgi:hypothetical protein